VQYRKAGLAPAFFSMAEPARLSLAFAALLAALPFLFRDGRAGGVS
jgi:hypothetical protein